MALREDWSPKQVSLWLRSNRGIRISYEWIYQYVLNDKLSGGDLRHLRCQKRWKNSWVYLICQAKALLLSCAMGYAHRYTTAKACNT
jgi:IS30 family transposase